MVLKDKDIANELQRRILVLDGAMGTMLQAMRLAEADYASGEFSGWHVPLKGNNDVLNITRPNAVALVHKQYIDAGADIITTNTFNSNRVSQGDYGLEGYAAAMARAGAQLARSIADECHSRKVWVAGSIGPTNKALSLASDMDKPESRAIGFDEMEQAYFEQAKALVEGGVDLLLVETCYDALNAKAALHAIARLADDGLQVPPVMTSVTVSDRSGRTLAGQTLQAFFASVAHYPMLSFGLNCSFGVADLEPLMRGISQWAPVFTCIYPNAGLPNAMGQYGERPDFTASHIKAMAQAGLLNIAGGCCGTTPSHIAAIAQAVKGVAPRRVPQQPLWFLAL